MNKLDAIYLISISLLCLFSSNVLVLSKSSNKMKKVNLGGQNLQSFLQLRTNTMAFARQSNNTLLSSNQSKSSLSFSVVPLNGSTQAKSVKKEPAMYQKYISFFRFKVDVCNNANCPKDHAKCTNTTTCECNKGFANVPHFQPGVCQYVQKRQIVAFLLEFFLSSGFGHFYIGNWITALLKLFVVLSIPIAMCVLTCFLGFFKSYSHWIYLGMTTIIGIWWVIDTIFFGMNKYLDGNGIPLEHW